MAVAPATRGLIPAWRKDWSPLANARRVLPAMASQWFAAADDALAPGKSWSEMHQFRLATKRFRYSLEIFQPLYGDRIKLRLKKLREIQSILGEINDRVATISMLDGKFAGQSERLSAEAASLEEQMRKLWQAKFTKTGKNWVSFLKGVR